MSEKKIPNSQKQKDYQFKEEKIFDYKHDIVKAFYKYVARNIAPIFLKYNVNPNTITTISGVFGMFGAMILLFDLPGQFFISAVLLQLFIILDFVDGVVARKSNQNSIFGVWLDIFFDKTNDFLIILCLTWSVFRETNEELFLILGVFMMGSVFFTQFIFLLNDTILKTIMKSKKKNDMSDSLYTVDAQKKRAPMGVVIVRSIKLLLSQISLNHAKFIALVSIFVFTKNQQLGMWVLTFGSLLTLIMNIVGNMRILWKRG